MRALLLLEMDLSDLYGVQISEIVAQLHRVPFSLVNVSQSRLVQYAAKMEALQLARQLSRAES